MTPVRLKRFSVLRGRPVHGNPVVRGRSCAEDASPHADRRSLEVFSQPMCDVGFRLVRDAGEP